jgi:hypothetical protein
VTEGESALTERVQCQRGNRRLQGSEGVRAVQSRSDGGGPNGSKRVQAGPRGVRAGPNRSIKIERGKPERE